VAFFPAFPSSEGGHEPGKQLFRGSWVKAVRHFFGLIFPFLLYNGVGPDDDGRKRPVQKEYRLKRRNDFRRVFQSGQSAANRQFVVVVLSRKTPGPPRIGVSVSRKVGKAVVRNRIRRLVKEVTRHWIPYLKPETDIVVIARAPAASMDYRQVKSSLRHVFQRAKLFHGAPPA
jgi:ribonuclease P protein component